MLFQKEKLKVRLLEKKDAPFIAKWLSDPHVLQYYEGRDNPFNLEKVYNVFFENETDTVKCLIEYENIETGYIQYYPLDFETRKVYGYLNEADIIFGIDQFIGEVKYWDRGIGQLLVSAMTDYLFHDKQASTVVMDPQSWNKRAIRCYEKCGYQKIKLMPKHELHEGEYRDCWLIEYRIDFHDKRKKR